MNSHVHLDNKAVTYTQYYVAVFCLAKQEHVGYVNFSLNVFQKFSLVAYSDLYDFKNILSACHQLGRPG